MKVEARAKINISLDVLGKLPDGYHAVETVMQSVSLADELDVELTEGGFVIDPGLPYLPDDERNLAFRAAKAFFEAAGMENAGARITIKKNIPVCAGLGGGSCDAAAVLRALNILTGKRFSADKLREIGETLGADVPFCVEGGTALGSGKGEKLKPLKALPDCGILICKPGFFVSTPELFAAIDAAPPKCHPNTAELLQTIEDGDLPKIARRMYNVFEEALGRRRSEISEIKSAMLDIGALGAVMSGTGSAVFGLFENLAKAEKALAVLKEKCRFCRAAVPTGPEKV